VIGRGDYHWQHEPLLVRGAQEGQLDRRQEASGGQDVETIHGTQKPVECSPLDIANDGAIGMPILSCCTYTRRWPRKNDV
jgi:hypothetical protein